MSNQHTTSNNSRVDVISKIGQKIVFSIGQTVLEVFYGLKNENIPYFPILAWGVLFDVLTLTRWDLKIFQLARMERLFPNGPIGYSIYCFFGATLGLWIWGFIQANRKAKMIERLTEVFIETGLKSPMGKLPNFISDKPVDELVRKLRVTNAFMPRGKFVEAKDRLESSLQVFIDEILESKSGGTIDLLYSHYEIAKMVELKDLKSIGRHRFLVGQTRARTIHSSLSEVPHLLIGGQTGGGKSTFLRQFITTLYCNNLDYSFTLIDMKGGLEFQLFENRDRIKVITTPNDSAAQLITLDELLTERFALLKANQCKDIDEFQSRPKEELILPNGIKSGSFRLNRNIVVIDEAAELFLAGGKLGVSQTQEITRKVIRLAAQGRAVGIHLVVATQKPDSKAINSQIKANLTGIVSFPMATLGASFSILGNGRAKDLPAIAGRAIWKSGLEQLEVQTAFLSPEQTKSELDKVSPIKEKAIEEATV